MNTSIFGLSPQAKYQNKKSSSSYLTITPLGGFGQIGMNCMLWSTAKAKVIVDCGLMFPSDYHLGIDVIIPDLSYLSQFKDEIHTLVLTHGHEDHIGAIPWLVQHLNLSIYGSPFTLALVEHKLRERDLLDRCKLIEKLPGDTLAVEDLRFHFFPVCHSIVDGYAFGVETPVGKVVHTGDFKIDPNPLSGPGTDLSLFRDFCGKQGATLLLSDSTNIEHEGKTIGEAEVMRALQHIFAAASGRIIVTLFSSHIQRIQEVFDCADLYGKAVIVSGRSLNNNIELATKINLLTKPKKLVLDDSLLPSYPSNEQVLLVTGSQGEPLSALSRIVNGQHRRLSINAGDVVIMSSRLIPGNAQAVNTLVNNIYRAGAEVYYDKAHPVHASGHACHDDLLAMLQAVRPRYFVPVHGEYRHLVKHRQLAVSQGVPLNRTLIVENGQPFTINEQGIHLEEKAEVEELLVDGKGVGDVGRHILRERHILGGEGLVVVVLALNAENWLLEGDIEIFSRGFVFEQQYSHLLDDAKHLALDALKRGRPGQSEKLSEAIRIDLRRFFKKVLGREPIIIPVIKLV